MVERPLPHYSKIRLPASADDLINDKLPQTEYRIVHDESDSDEIEEVVEALSRCTVHNKHNEDNNNETVLKLKAFLTQITTDSGINDQYTIYPMNAKRIGNESALKLYKMLKIEDIQNELQYLFFLLNDANYRQLNNGMYYTMMVANPRERYTAGRYLNELKDNQLESNLMSIFAKLRNTDQFWRQPSNNVKCMTLHYGPATWFLTLSPSERKWSDLAEYLRDMNSDKEKLGISELIAYDPLPITHESMAKYTHLSDMVLKTLREKLKNFDLFIIDEVSMISNVTLMFINLRLCEIFDTTDTDDGFFGRKHILLFGDLLQLPPVKEQFPFVKMSRSEIQKYLSTMGGSDLWRLFEYDELLINMRQRCDNTYREILSRIRIGLVTDSDINVLQSRKINFKGSCDERLNELCTYMNQLPVDTICLLPTCYLCTTLNTAMLDKINGDEILLIAEDDVDCAPAMKKKVHKILKDKDEKVSETAGIERVIAIKIGAKVMIRRNIDITLGLVNGTIGIVIAIHRSIDGNRIDSVTIVTSDNKQVIITRVDIKFEVFHKIVVHRKQFPLSLSYGITVHKSQGITCKNAMMDLGTTISVNGFTRF
ncbi:PREDICTED: LOW QUALITY PROTEIN: ATP-dependent DNA helicase pif1-like [Trachymyrmex cornetzi]|uniref:LOW QUALITY PROTEIN: ATP-dependent DNA helicase pif1-like n=1 Tax=Trachymyrmex cornetzi TaxID=471704 RepID=UPI00084EDCB5|nr:PREDICTED: LOW QUALITY PROTEIN: ATP-dependent DNA helicase pif1-like [Trachymyrmex cornetzi]